MNKNLLNILSNSNKEIDNQKLMDYLSGRLSHEEVHEIEKQMAENEFMNDAMEGLTQVKQTGALSDYVEQINRDLAALVEKKQARRQKRKFRDQPLIYVAIVLVLAFIVLAYYVLHNLP
jgi:anti-sigma factor RsiW